MIINIFGPSGSGKTTFIRNLLKANSIHKFFRKYSNEISKDNLNKGTSISLIPIPLFRGTVGEFFDIFSINIDNLLFQKKELKVLAKSIFGEIDNDILNAIASRRLETLSAGEIRRLFILKSILVESSLMIIDEPFSNSDKKLWRQIYESIDLKKRSIILSHYPLKRYFDTKKNYICINFNK